MPGWPGHRGRLRASPSQWERATVQVSPWVLDLEAEDLESKGAFMEGHRGQHTPPTESSELRLQGGGSPSVTYTPVSGAAGTPLAAPVWRPIAAPQLVSPLGSGSALPLAFPTAGYVGRRPARAQHRPPRGWLRAGRKVSTAHPACVAGGGATAGPPPAPWTPAASGRVTALQGGAR